MVSPIATPFPRPPESVIRALRLLEIVRRGDQSAIEQAGIAEKLPRPWDPASCPPDLRDDVWDWCDVVAMWINHEYVWRPMQLIPPCWRQHPHIARELAVLAFLRWDADGSVSPGAVEDWHRYAYPMFSDRMTTRLGESTCRTGVHAPWPSRSRLRLQTDTTTAIAR